MCTFGLLGIYHQISMENLIILNIHTTIELSNLEAQCIVKMFDKDIDGFFIKKLSQLKQYQIS